MATPSRQPSNRVRRQAPGLERLAAPAWRAARRARNVAAGTRAAREFARALPSRTAELASPVVVLDGCALQEPHTGIARLWRSVMHEWSVSGFARNVVVLDRAGSAPCLPGFTYLSAPPLVAHDISAERAMLDAVCRSQGADLFVTTLYSYPDETPGLLMVHDLTPEILGWDLSAPLWRDKRAAIQRAAAFLCNSRNTASDLNRIYPKTAHRPTTIALPGVDSSFAPSSAEEVAAVRARYALPENYYVFVGHRDIHKNAELVFDTVELGPEIPEYGLLLLGGRPDLEPHFAEQAGDVPVRITRLSDDELRAAYTGAAALLFPSRYEGFGLVALEAMACGCPVITCRNSAIPEAVDDTALFVGEDDPLAMKRAMEAVLDPATRAELVAGGRAWSASFTWSRIAHAAEMAIREAADA